MRSVDHELRVLPRFAVDVDHCFDKGVEIGATDGFGWLDEHCAFDHEREVHGRRVKAVIDQTLRDIERYDAFL